MSCEHAFLTLLDALEIQRGILGDASRGADTDTGPHRAAFEAIERAAVTEANRLTGDASVPAVVRARTRAFVAATTRTPTRSGLRAAMTPAPGAVVPRMTTPVAQLSTVAALPRTPTGTRPGPTMPTSTALTSPPSPPRTMTPQQASSSPPSSSSSSSSSSPPWSSPPSSSSSPPAPAATTLAPLAVRPQTSPASAFPGLAAVGALGAEAPPPQPAQPTLQPPRVRVEDHLASLTVDWTCPHCTLANAKGLHVARVLGGRDAVVVDVVCANCARRSPLPSAQLRAFDRLFGPFIAAGGSGFRPDAHGLRWDGT